MPSHLFPNHFQIILDEYERGAMQDLWDHNPQLDDHVALFHAVLHEGIKVMNRAAEARQPEPTRTHLEAGKRSAAQTVSQRGLVQEPAFTPTPHRQVESYVATFVGERLRHRIQRLLDQHPEVDEETAYALLLDLGLAKAEEDPEALDPASILADLKSKQTQSRAAARRRRLERLAQVGALFRRH